MARTIDGLRVRAENVQGRLPRESYSISFDYFITMEIIGNGQRCALMCQAAARQQLVKLAVQNRSAGAYQRDFVQGTIIECFFSRTSRSGCPRPCRLAAGRFVIVQCPFQAKGNLAWASARDSFPWMKERGREEKYGKEKMEKIAASPRIINGAYRRKLRWKIEST